MGSAAPHHREEVPEIMPVRGRRTTTLDLPCREGGVCVWGRYICLPASFKRKFFFSPSTELGRDPVCLYLGVGRAWPGTWPLFMQRQKPGKKTTPHHPQPPTLLTGKGSGGSVSAHRLFSMLKSCFIQWAVELIGDFPSHSK